MGEQLFDYSIGYDVIKSADIKYANDKFKTPNLLHDKINPQLYDRKKKKIF